jgi:hypothetical protein
MAFAFDFNPFPHSVAGSSNFLPPQALFIAKVGDTGDAPPIVTIPVRLPIILIYLPVIGSYVV